MHLCIATPSIQQNLTTDAASVQRTSLTPITWISVVYPHRPAFPVLSRWTTQKRPMTLTAYPEASVLARAPLPVTASVTQDFQTALPQPAVSAATKSMPTMCSVRRSEQLHHLNPHLSGHGLAREAACLRLLLHACKCRDFVRQSNGRGPLLCRTESRLCCPHLDDLVHA